MEIQEAQGLLKQWGVKQEEVARHMSIDPSLLSRYLSGDRKAPKRIVLHLFETITRLARAEVAATEAREAVLKS